jgi:ankyrin repeat protein
MLTSSSHVYLGYLRILYETICSSLRAISPNAFVLRHGQEVHCRLISMAGNIVQDYKRWLWEFIAEKDDEESAQTELRLLRAIRGIGLMNTTAGKEMFREQKVQIYERLISIYKDECNGPEVESYMILLEEISSTEPTLGHADATIASQIADSMKRTSQELITVSDEISRNLESPLLESPWLHQTHTPFSPLHRALRARLDKITNILAKEENGLDDRDFLKRRAIQVAAECGNTQFLEEHLRDNSHLKGHRDILNRTAAFVAADHGNLEAFQTLVRGDRTLIKARDIDGATLMDVLAAGGYTDFARYLLDLDFPIKEPPVAAASPLHTAAERGHTEFCDLLLEAGVDARFVLPGPNGNGYTAAMVAHHKSCEATNSEVKAKFYALALRIAKAEGPPHYSLNKIQRQPGEAERSTAGNPESALRSLGPSLFPPNNTLRPIGCSSIHTLADSSLPSGAKQQQIGQDDLNGSSSAYPDSRYPFISASMSMD